MTSDDRTSKEKERDDEPNCKPRRPHGGLLALAVLPLLWPNDAQAQACTDKATELIAGRTIDAGNINVCNDDTTLTVTYEATFPWCLLETHLHVATSESDIPQTRRGNPIPGRFDGSGEHNCGGTVTFEILLADIDGGVSFGDTVVIGAHAKVDDGERRETAWGDGPGFVERGNWATFFTYTVEEPGVCGGASSCTVFVTSTFHNGDFGGLTDADAICQGLADASSTVPAGTYKAWLSDATSSPSTRFTQGSVPYTLVNGTTVANDWTELTSGTLQNPINVTENGTSVFQGNVRTGTATDGTGKGANCSNWKSSGLGDGGLSGRLEFTDSSWTDGRELGCNSGMRLYCFQQ